MLKELARKMRHFFTPASFCNNSKQLSEQELRYPARRPSQARAKITSSD